MTADERPDGELTRSAISTGDLDIGIPYCKVIRLLGEGGMGVVYHAHQSGPIRRDVALKIIKPGMDTMQVIARFESERQALALMDHPNIAHGSLQHYRGGEQPRGSLPRARTRRRCRNAVPQGHCGNRIEAHVAGQAERWRNRAPR